jgi:hypothetical protein
LLKVKDLYLAGKKVKIGVGNLARFWEDSWLYERPLADCYPELYSICHDQHVLAQHCCEKQWQLSFRRWLSEPLQQQWDIIKQKLSNFHFIIEDDQVR